MDAPHDTAVRHGEIALNVGNTRAMGGRSRAHRRPVYLYRDPIADQVNMSVANDRAAIDRRAAPTDEMIITKRDMRRGAAKFVLHMAHRTRGRVGAKTKFAQQPRVVIGLVEDRLQPARR